MFGRVIRRFVNRFGYRLSKLSSRSESGDAFEDMQYLCRGVQCPTIFDVGAHHGHVSRHFRYLFPDSVVYSFEPFPESYKSLVTSTSSDKGILQFNFGFSDSEGAKFFSSNVDSGTNSLLETDPVGVKNWGNGHLETLARVVADFSTVDEFITTNRIDCIDVLKMDVQGAEPRVLAGARHALANKMVRIVYAEIIIVPTYQGQMKFWQTLEMYEKCGMQLFNLYNPLRARDGVLQQLDAVFVQA